MKLYQKPGLMVTELIFHDRAPELRQPWEYLPEAARDFIRLFGDGEVKLIPSKSHPSPSHFAWTAERFDASINDAFFSIAPSFWFDYRDLMWTMTVRAREKDTEVVIRVPRNAAEIEEIMSESMVAEMRAGWMRFSRDPSPSVLRPLP